VQHTHINNFLSQRFDTVCVHISSFHFVEVPCDGEIVHGGCDSGFVDAVLGIEMGVGVLHLRSTQIISRHILNTDP